jgi:hypothetical protein
MPVGGGRATRHITLLGPGAVPIEGNTVHQGLHEPSGPGEDLTQFLGSETLISLKEIYYKVNSHFFVFLNMQGFLFLKK